MIFLRQLHKTASVKEERRATFQVVEEVHNSSWLLDIYLEGYMIIGRRQERQTEGYGNIYYQS